MTEETELEHQIKELPCDAKLAYVVLEKRGPFTHDEIREETYLSDDETLYALAVLEEEGLVDKFNASDRDVDVYEVSG